MTICATPYRLGTPIDEATKVYTVGATAFALFGGYERTIDRWELSEQLFAVACSLLFSND